MPVQIQIEEFLELSNSLPVIDVRSEGEFKQGHIPGAFNVPVMNDEERAAVGTAYKRNGRQNAILKGLELTGPYLKDRLKSAAKKVKNDRVLVYCWRGGMRSGFFSYLLEFYGLKPVVLKGGYKSFRHLVLKEFDKPRELFVLGGMTGSGKTEVLNELKKTGQQVLDLEGIARHKGSAFGGIGQGQQPTQEQFENYLAAELMKSHRNEPLWLEDEGRTIGSKVIPIGLWNQKQSAFTFILKIDFEKRLEYIYNSYGFLPVESLMEATQKIAKRLGNEQFKESLALLEQGRIKEGLAFSLRYYDKAYQHLQNKKAEIEQCLVYCETTDALTNAQLILAKKNEILKK